MYTCKIKGGSYCYRLCAMNYLIEINPATNIKRTITSILGAITTINNACIPANIE